jgi:thymidylate synthase (FAD)
MTLKLIWEPKVYLLGSQLAHAEAFQDFLEDSNISLHTWSPTLTPEGLTEIAGRLCYMSFDKPRPGGMPTYLRHLLEVGHGSVLEHAVWNFIFTGISRSLSHELVRHRVGWGYSQLSQRYVDSSDVAFVVPDGLRPEVEAYERLHAWVNGYCETSNATPNDAVEAYYGFHPEADKGEANVGRDWCRFQQNALHEYEEITKHLADKFVDVQDKTEKRKRARQTARSVLPNCTETKIFATANARTLRSTIEQRCSRHAEPEIRKLFYKVWQVVRVEAPNIFGDYEETPLPDGTIELTTKYKKV